MGLELGAGTVEGAWCWLDSREDKQKIESRTTDKLVGRGASRMSLAVGVRRGEVEK